LAKLMATILILFVVSAISVFGFNPDSLFIAGNRAYENKDYKAALDNYLQLEQYNYLSAPLYFNIGNCYFKEGKLGYSVLYYMRAQRLNPRDEDIKNNLAFARQFLPTSLEGVKINPVASFLDTITSPFTLNGLAWLSSLFFILLFLLLAAAVYFRIGGLGVKIFGYAMLILLLIFASMTTYKYRTEYLTHNGVIVANEAQIYSGPGVDNDLEFVGAYGLSFKIEKETGGYYLVIFENGRKGWISKASVEVI
jgi:tetratricopeptide (TPR) repeat protein